MTSPDFEKMAEDARQANHGFADAEMTARHAYLKGLEAAKGIAEKHDPACGEPECIAADIRSAIEEASRG